MSLHTDSPTKHTYAGVEFNIWDDTGRAGPDGWSVYPKPENLAPLQYQDVSKGDLIEDLERLIEDDAWPEKEDRDEEYRRSVKYEDRRQLRRD